MGGKGLLRRMRNLMEYLEMSKCLLTPKKITDELKKAGIRRQLKDYSVMKKSLWSKRTQPKTVKKEHTVVQIV